MNPTVPDNTPYGLLAAVLTPFDGLTVWVVHQVVGKISPALNALPGAINAAIKDAFASACDDCKRKMAA